MVKVIDGILGTPTGKSGTVVYRKVNGKTFASVRPEKYKASRSKQSLSNRNRFAAAVAFSKYVNSIPELKLVWNSVKIKGCTSYNRLIKHNIKHISDNRLTTYNIITPDSQLNRHIYLSVDGLNMDKKNISLSFLLSNEKQLPSEALIFIITAFQDPVRKSYPPVTMSHLFSVVNPVENGKEFDLKLQLNTMQKKTADKYKECIIYIGGIFENPNPKKIKFTNTFAKRFNLPVI